MTLQSKLIIAAAAGIVFLSAAASAQNLGELKVQFALDGRTQTFAPDKLFGGDIKKTRNGQSYLYVAWRQGEGTSAAPANIATFNAYEGDEKRFGLGVSFEKDKKSFHYASRCSPNTMPRCDPNTQGLRHDAQGKKVMFKNAVFERVSLDKIDPKDTITVTGELSYAQ